MIATAVTFYDVALWLHITAVVVGFGPTFAYAMFAAVASQEGVRGSLTVAKGIVAWNKTGLNIAMVIILLSGLYIASDRWDFGEFFVGWGIIAILVLFGIVHGYFGPRERRVVEVLEAEVQAGRGESDERPEEFSKLEGEIDRMGMIAGLIVIVTIYVMTAKPFL